MTIYKCNICGNIITMLEDKGPIPVCCGDTMTMLNAKTDDDFHEKHVPVVEHLEACGNCVKVTVGSVIHPMTDEHRIDWIGLETNKGFRVFYLNTGMDPIAEFMLGDTEKIKTVYAYCNIHGLWKTELKWQP